MYMVDYFSSRSNMFLVPESQFRHNTMESSRPSTSDNDSGYSSDSSFENYYLWCEEERDFIKFVESHLASEHAAGRLSSGDYPLSLIQDLMGRMRKKKKWKKINGDTDYIKKVLAYVDEEIKKKSAAAAFRKRSMKRKAGDQDSLKKFRKRIMYCSPSNRSVTFGESTSRWFQPTARTSSESSGRTLVINPAETPRGGATGESSSGESLGNRSEPPTGGAIGGASIRVMKRELNKSDVDDHQQRLSMPCNQAPEVPYFLTEEERKKLENKLYVPIKVIDPENRTYDAKLRKTMAGPKTYSYAIGKPWNDVKRKNGFRAGMGIDILALRGKNKELCFRLQRADGES